jgi:predicted nuclease of predicted toxin-antitoxin system
MKFKLDENLSNLGKSLLEADGHDVMTVREQNLRGASDVALFGVCRDEGRVLITLDHDFRQTLRFPPEESAGLVVLECRGRLSPANILARIEEFAAVLKSRPIKRELWIVEPGRVRIHQSRE